MYVDEVPFRDAVRCSLVQVLSLRIDDIGLHDRLRLLQMLSFKVLCDQIAITDVLLHTFDNDLLWLRTHLDQSKTRFDMRQMLQLFPEVCFAMPTHALETRPQDHNTPP